MRVVMRAVQRLLRAGEDGDIGLANLRGEKGVPRRLFEVDIAGHGCQAEDPDARLGKRHDDRDGVIGGGVGVDEEIAHGS